MTFMKCAVSGFSALALLTTVAGPMAPVAAASWNSGWHRNYPPEAYPGYVRDSQPRYGYVNGYRSESLGSNVRMHDRIHPRHPYGYGDGYGD